MALSRAAVPTAATPTGNCSQGDYLYVYARLRYLLLIGGSEEVGGGFGGASEPLLSGDRGTLFRRERRGVRERGRVAGHGRGRLVREGVGLWVRAAEGGAQGEFWCGSGARFQAVRLNTRARVPNIARSIHCLAEWGAFVRGWKERRNLFALCCMPGIAPSSISRLVFLAVRALWNGVSFSLLYGAEYRSTRVLQSNP